MEKYLKIKAFSKLTGLSVRTLQYYDQLGLLQPAKVTEQGYRLYDDRSFSQAFIIGSLKRIGMPLSEIQEYLAQNQTLTAFVEAGKQRVETEMMELQLRLLKLTRIEQYLAKEQTVPPHLLTLVSETELPEELLTKLSPAKVAFNLAETEQFFKELAFCYEQKLPASDPRAQKCLATWQQMELAPELTAAAENYYAQHPEQAYGMRPEWYLYLKKLAAK